jgi:protoporphyrinogen oxidase
MTQRPGNPRIIIIGGGPTGLGAAWRLHELGHDNWTLLEASDHVGGLAASVTDPNGFTWDLGGHVVFSHYAYFDRLLDGLLQDAWVEHVREAWVWIRQRFIPYPLQNNLWRLPPDDLSACLDGLLEIHGNGHQAPPPDNFRTWIEQTFGRGLADIFMLPYNFKVWAYDPAELGVGWMGERVAGPDLRRILHNLVYRRDDVGWGPNARFRFPRRGGTGAIWRALAGRLPAQRLILNAPVVQVDGDRRRVRCADGTELSYDYIISTMPLDELLRRLVSWPSLARLAEGLAYSSSHIVGIGVGAPPADVLRTKCWMYFPETDSPYYRVTVFSNYAPDNVPRPGRQSSLLAEVSESPRKPRDAETLMDETITALIRDGLLPAGAPIVSRWQTRLEYSYPTPFLGRDRLLSQIQPRLEHVGIYSRGRFGGWKYEVGNQDHSAMQGVEVAERLLTGSPEQTYVDPSQVNARPSA